MASRISVSTSWRVCPDAMQPSRSGEYAENPVAVSSTTIKYFFIFLDLAVSRRCCKTRSQIVPRLSGDRNQSRFRRMLVLAMTATSPVQIPTILFEHPDYISYLHLTPRPQPVTCLSPAHTRCSMHRASPPPASDARG